MRLDPSAKAFGYHGWPAAARRPINLPPEMLEKHNGRAFGDGLWAFSCLTNRRQAARATPRISNVRPCANDGGGPISESATPFNGGAWS